jgi:Rne/Rng family ribonuclease
LRAVLVEIGLARPAYLSLDDAASKPASATLYEGAAVLVQVKRDPRADKAAGVTMRLRLSGRYIDWTPTRPGVRVDVVDESERARVATILEAALRPDEGAVARASAATASQSAIVADIAKLRSRWADVEERRRACEPPCRVEAANPIGDLLGELADERMDTIVVDDAAALAELRHWLAREQPALIERLERYRGDAPLFEAEGIADAVAALAVPRVRLQCGGALEIAPTAAAVLIDVDSGPLSEEQHLGEEALLAVDLAAAAEIARQIRLRGLAGALIVDFVPMTRRHHRERLLEAFRAALKVEVPEAQLLGLTRLGHVELTRPRRRAALHEIVSELDAQGRWTKTALTVALDALSETQRLAHAAPVRRTRLRVNPRVAAILAGEGSGLRHALEARLGQALEIVAEPARAQESFAIERD